MQRTGLAPPVILLVIAALGPSCSGCNEDPKEPTWADEARELESRPARSAQFNTSRRCAECHARQHREWQGSAHGRAAGGVFARVRETLEDDARLACDACHVPLAAASERIARDGVGCDACHTATGHGEGQVAVALQPELAVKFGPYDDSRDHNFHRVAFSEFVTGAALCEACHADRTPGPVPIFTSVAEWRAGPDADKPCQSCHMPKAQAEAAKGERVRQVAHHGFGGEKAAALEAAVRLDLRVVRTPAGPVGRAQLHHQGGGHPLPTGLPERRLLLVLEAAGAGGQVLARQERRYGRRLVDAQGNPAPFFQAVREEGDERLVPGEPRVEELALPRGTQRVSATLLYERFDPALAEVYGETAPVQVAHRETTVEGRWD
jgi:hypothetical protein